MKHKLAPALPCILLLAASGLLAADPPACDVSGLEPGRGGYFEAAVIESPSRTAEMSGFAGGSSEERGYAMHMTVPGGKGAVLFYTPGKERPEPGRYPIVDYIGTDATPAPGQFVVNIVPREGIVGLSGYFSIKGTLTVVSSTPDHVSGCLHFSAQDMQGKNYVDTVVRFVGLNQDH
ncbi:hypothetical protein ABI59_08455 [Acidobacteria bacterium Mor1]|nr:hypothetical protein ABI59_08455 [Acidobacteria bacterium Mor1]